MKSSSKKQYNPQFNTNSLNNPKPTEILNMFDTFLTMEPQPKYTFLPSNRKITNTNIPSLTASKTLYNNSLFLDQCSIMNCKSLKHVLREVNKKQINNFILPKIKPQNNEKFTNLIQNKPEKKYLLNHIAQDIVNDSLSSPNIHELRSTYLIDKVLRDNQKMYINIIV